MRAPVLALALFGLLALVGVGLAGASSDSITLTSSNHSCGATPGSQSESAAPCPPPSGSFTATYFNNMTLSGNPVVTQNSVPAPLNYNWGTGSPVAGVNADDFSARYTGDFTFSDGTYDFHVLSDDGSRVFVDGVKIIDDWIDQSAWNDIHVQRAMTAGVHQVTVEYYEDAGRASLASGWSQVGTPPPPPPPPSDRTTRLDWFYGENAIPPLATVLDRFREIILSGHSVEDGYLARLRNAGWTSANGYGPVYGYVDFQFAEGPASCASDPNYSGLTTSWTSWDGEFCSMVNPHEDWFLHQPNGQRVTPRSGGWYYMNPTSQGWRSYIAGKVQRYFASQFPGLDGLFLDDLWANKSSTPNCGDCPSDAAWHAGTMQTLQAIRAALPAGKKLTYNSSPGDDSQAGYAGLADGFMVEMLGTGWCDGCWESQSDIEQHLADTDAEVAAGGDVLEVGQGDSSASIQQMRFSHALYLMVAGPHVSYRFGNAGSYQWWDYPEYQWNLGTPSGARTHATPTVLRRDFSAGMALANMGSTSQTIALGGTYLTPSGASVTSVTLGAHEGMALRAA